MLSNSNFWLSFFQFVVSVQDIAEHLTTLYLKHCERGNRCLYKGSTPPGVFRNSWVILSVKPMEMSWFLLNLWCYNNLVIAFLPSWQNGAMYCNLELAMEKYNEIHTCDRGYDDNRNQVSFCSLICVQLYYLHEHLTTLVLVEIKAKTFNGSAFVLLGTVLGSKGRSLWVQAYSCLLFQWLILRLLSNNVSLTFTTFNFLQFCLVEYSQI